MEKTWKYSIVRPVFVMPFFLGGEAKCLCRYLLFVGGERCGEV
jgi:hypothetical protein